MTFTDRVAGEQNLFVDQTQLGLHPIDVLFRAHAGADQAVGDLEDRILHHIECAHAPRHDLPIVLGFTIRVDGRVNWFELQALLRSLRELLVASRPLQPADLMRPNDAQSDDQVAIELDRDQVQDPHEELENALTALAGVAAAAANAAVTVDDALTQFATTAARFAAFRLQQSGTGFVYEWRARVFAALCDRITRRAASWTERLNRYDARVAEYDALEPATPDAERIAPLRDAELLIGAFTDPIPTDPDDYRNTVLPPKRGAFAARRDAMQALVANSRPTLAHLLADTAATRVAGDFDFAAFTVTAEEAEVASFRAQLAETIAQLDIRARERSTPQRTTSARIPRGSHARRGRRARGGGGRARGDPAAGAGGTDPLPRDERCARELDSVHSRARRRQRARGAAAARGTAAHPGGRAARDRARRCGRGRRCCARDCRARISCTRKRCRARAQSSISRFSARAGWTAGFLLVRRAQADRPRRKAGAGSRSISSNKRMKAAAGCTRPEQQRSVR